MVLSTLTEGLSNRFGDKKTIELIANAGFDAIDYSMFCLSDKNCSVSADYLKEIKATADECGVYFNQTHAPFPSYKFNNDLYNDEMFAFLIKSIEYTSYLGAKHIVMHPVICPDGVFQKKFNVDFYKKLIPYCEQYNVVIALENIFGRNADRTICPNVCSFATQQSDYVDAFESPWVVACLDIGHCGLVGEDAANAIKTLGNKRLKALHIHDNDFMDDLHTMPYLGKIDWDNVLKALSGINYSGDFTFEAMNYYNNFDDNNIEKGLKYLHDIGRSMIEKIERS